MHGINICRDYPSTSQLAPTNTKQGNSRSVGNAVTLNISVKEKEDAHADPEIQPMKEDDGTFGEYR